jgi:hypothetical protein
MKIKVVVSDCTPDQAGIIAAFLKELAVEGDVTPQIDRTAAEIQKRMYPTTPPFVQQPTTPPFVQQPAAPTPPPAQQPPAPPATPKAPTPPPAATGELDVRGVPWHAAHHAGTKGKNQDGTWKRLKGTDKDVVAAYEAQFTSRPGVPPSTPTPPASSGGVPAATHSAPPTIPPAAPAADMSAGVPIHNYSPPTMPPAPPAPPAPDVDYGTFYTLYIGLCQATALTQERVGEMNQAAGVTDLSEYANDASKRARAYQYMQGLQMQLAA